MRPAFTGSHCLAAVVAAAVLLAAGPRAGQMQDPQQAQTQPRPPIFRAGANFVVVDAYPRVDGRLVEPLAKSDFEILEDGKPQAIELLELIRVPPNTADADRRDPSSVADAERQAADPRSRVMVLYLGLGGMTLEGIRAARGLGVDFLRRTIGPADLFGIMTSDMTLDQLTLSRRVEVAEGALAKYWHDRFEDAAGPANVEPRNKYEQLLYNCFIAKGVDIAALIIGHARVEQFLNTMKGLSIKLGSLRDQRSTLVLFSGGLSLGSPSGLTRYAWNQGARPGVDPSGRLSFEPRRDPRLPGNTATCDAELNRLAANDYQEMFRAILDAARRSNVVVYPVDPSGLSPYDLNVGDQYGKDPWTRVNARFEPLRTLASYTGGQAIVATNNARELLARVADDLASYYLLGYYSTNGKFDGKYRSIEVKVRRPDVKVSHRRGYLAPTDEMVRAADAARDRSTATVRSEPAEIDLVLAGLEKGRRGDVLVRAVVQGTELAVAAEVAATALRGLEADGARVLLSAFAGDGSPIGSRAETLAPGARSMLVRFPLPAASAGPWRVAVRIVTPDGALLNSTNAARGGPLLDEPLVYRGGQSPQSPFAPVAGLEFRRTERIRLEWRLATPLDQRQARLLGRNGGPLAVPVTMSEREENGRRVLVADLTLAPLATGDYVIEVTASAGTKSDRKLLAFSVR